MVNRVKTCFVSAPLGANLGALRAALEGRGVRVLVPQDLMVGADWASEIHKEISRADLVIGVIPSVRQAPWVLFELGLASALGRRIVLITSPKTEPIPFSSHQLVTLRIDLTNTDAIEFALDQLMTAPAPSRERMVLSKSAPGLGLGVDALITELERSLAQDDGRQIERIVADALRRSGADIVRGSADKEFGADLAVWSDVLEPFVGNPLLVEVKTRLKTKPEANAAAQKLALQVGASGSRWAVLLYGEGPQSGFDLDRQHPNILIVSLRSLLEGLRDRSFPELIRDLRNRRVHGASS